MYSDYLFQILYITIHHLLSNIHENNRNFYTVETIANTTLLYAPLTIHNIATLTFNER